jgi:hypothetical protein
MEGFRALREVTIENPKAPSVETSPDGKTLLIGNARYKLSLKTPYVSTRLKRPLTLKEVWIAIKFGQGSTTTQFSKYVVACTKNRVERLDLKEFKALLTFMSDGNSTTSQLDFTVADQDETQESEDVGEGSALKRRRTGAGGVDVDPEDEEWSVCPSVDRQNTATGAKLTQSEHHPVLQPALYFCTGAVRQDTQGNSERATAASKNICHWQIVEEKPLLIVSKTWQQQKCP